MTFLYAVAIFTFVGALIYSINATIKSFETS